MLIALQLNEKQLATFEANLKTCFSTLCSLPEIQSLNQRLLSLLLTNKFFLDTFYMTFRDIELALHSQCTSGGLDSGFIPLDKLDLTQKIS